MTQLGDSLKLKFDVLLSVSVAIKIRFFFKNCVQADHVFGTLAKVAETVAL